MANTKIIDGWKMVKEVADKENASCKHRCQLWYRYKDSKVKAIDLYVGLETEFFKVLQQANLDYKYIEGNGKNIKKTERLYRDENAIKLFFEYATKLDELTAKGTWTVSKDATKKQPQKKRNAKPKKDTQKAV